MTAIQLYEGIQIVSVFILIVAGIKFILMNETDTETKPYPELIVPRDKD